MRFLLLTMSLGERSAPPGPEHRANIRKILDDELASGKLVAAGGFGKRATAAARVTARAGQMTIEDPPAGDGWLAAGGFLLIDVASKEEAIARAKLTLAMGEGTVELIQVTDMHPRPAPSGD